MKPKISIIVPIYNVEKYLDKCLQSICRQTYSNFEAILIDDGSTDKSYEICEQYARKDPRIKIIQEENSGVVTACKNGIIHSHGDFICFIDSDDIIERNYLNSLVKAHDEFNADIVLSQICRYRNGKKTEYKLNINSGYYDKETYQKKFLFQILSNGKFQSRLIPPTRWGKLIPKDLIEKNLKYYQDDITYVEDILLMLPIFLDMQSLYVLPDRKETRYLYRIRENSIITGYDANRWHSVNKGYRYLYQALKDKDLVNNKNLVDQLKLDYFSSIIQCCTNEIKNKNGNYKKFKTLIYEIRQNSLNWKPDIKKIKFDSKNKFILSLIYYGNNVALYNCYSLLKIGYSMKLKLGRKKD